ncbi:hypothetical protein RI054_41g149360 [Pseudoscourfieldia marina]
MGKIVWATSPPPSGGATTTSDDEQQQQNNNKSSSCCVNLSNPKTWATTNATGPSTLTSLPTSRNPNFAPRQSWPEEKYNIKYPSNWQPGKHRFETFKDKRGSDFGDKTKPKPKRKNSAGASSSSSSSVAKKQKKKESAPPAAPPSLTLEQRLSKPLGWKK